MAVTFDTHKAVTRLRRKAGFDENQAMAVVETVSDVLVDNLATREDMALLRSEVTAEVATLRGEINAGLAAVRGEMHTELTAARGEMRAELTAVRGDLEKTEVGLRGDIATLRADLMAEMHKQGRRMTTRLGAVAVAAVGIMVAFDKLL